MMNVTIKKTKYLALVLALIMAVLLCAPVAYAEETTEGGITTVDVESAAEGAITDSTTSEGGITDATITDGAITDDTTSDSAITEDTTSDGAITDDTTSDGAITDGDGSDADTEEPEPVRGIYVAVGIKYGSSAVSKVDMYSDYGFQIVDITDGIVETLPLTGYSHLVITAKNGMINVSDENGVTLVTDLGKNGVIMNGDWLGEGRFKSSVNSRTYRGGLKFHIRDNGDINVINYLSLDHYLYGVIQGEMGHQNPLESLKAQTVAARSYVMCNQNRHKSEGFDVCNVSHCQMYYGVDYEKVKTIQAVDETTGMVLWYNNKIVPAYYSKNNGGYVQATEDVWGNVTGYLKAKEDPWSPEYAWTASYEWSDLEERITDIGQIKDAYITKWTDNGNVYEMVFEGSLCTKTLLREKIRTTLGGSTCKSLRFELEGGSGETIVIPAKATVLGADGVKEERKDVVVYGAEETGISLDSLDGLVLLGADGTTTLKNTETQSMASDEGIALTGYGYGHGIGMAQDSAIAMGEAGLTYEEILHFFYTDIEIDHADRNDI